MYLNYYSSSTLIYTLLNFCIYLHPHVTIVWREEIHIYQKKAKIILTWRQAREHGLRVPCSRVENHRRWGGWKNIRMIGKWDVTETLVLFVLHKNNLYVLMLSHLVKLDRVNFSSKFGVSAHGRRNSSIGWSAHGGHICGIENYSSSWSICAYPQKLQNTSMCVYAQNRISDANFFCVHPQKLQNKQT